MFNIWTQVRHFTILEKWGDASRMNGALLLLMEQIRINLGRYIVVHCGFAVDGHSENSQHYSGNAIDFHVAGMSHEDAYYNVVEILESLQVDERCGLGVYPDWNSPGFHLDLRGFSARWAFVDGKQVSIESVFERAV